MKYSEDIIRRVQDSIDIVDLISGYVSLRKQGRNHIGLCPFHSEKTPSFSVSPDKQIFYCFGCHAGGSVFKFLELQEGLSFPEAVRHLADRAGITLPENRPRADEKKSDDERKALLRITAEAADYFRRELEGPSGRTARAYLAKRGLTEAVIRDFGLGWSRNEWDGLLKHLQQKGNSPAMLEKAGLVVKRKEGEGHYDRFRGRIIFPIRDISGHVIAFGGRVLDDTLPKYLNSPETPLYSKSNVLYFFDQAKEPARKQGYFIIVEGYLDAIACHQYGAKNAVATLGTALTDGHLRLMRRFAQKLMLIFDPDPAGIRATIRGFDPLVQSGMKVNVVSLPDGNDPDTFFQKHGKNAFDKVLRNSIKLMDFVLSEVIKIGPKAPIDERMDTAKEIALFIEKLPDGNVQNEYIKKIIDALDINEGIFRQERFRERHEIKKGRQESNQPAIKRRPQAEENLIHLMLRDEAIARKAKDQVSPEDFTDPLFRKVAARIYEVLSNGAVVDIQSLFIEGDEDLNKLISRFVVLDLECEKDKDQNNINLIKEKTYRDCIDFIKQQDPEKKMTLLTKAIQVAEAKGDHAEVSRLIEEQNNLGKRPGRQHGKRVPGM